MQFKIPFTLPLFIIFVNAQPTRDSFIGIADNIRSFFNSTSAQLAGGVGAGLAVGASAWAVSTRMYPNQPANSFRYQRPRDSYRYAQSLKELNAYQQLVEEGSQQPRDTRTTIISLFYPAEDNPGNKIRKPLSLYLERMSRLLANNRPTIMYTTPGIANEIRANIRKDDPYLILIDDYQRVEDIPNVRDECDNFELIQAERFPKHLKHPWTVAYNNPHNMKTYTAKAWVIRDGIERNPFNSEIFLFSDAGLFCHDDEPRQAAWGDTEKLKATLASIPRDSIAISQVGRLKELDHACWTDKERILECHSFAANGFFGYKKGMVRFAEAMFREFELMNANEWYVGREEFIMSRMALGNKGLLRGFEAWKDPENLDNPHKRWWAFGKALGAEEPLTLVDPFVNPTPATWYSEQIPFF